MDLQARMAELEAQVRELDDLAFGTTEAGNIPADEYFAAREAGGELAELAHEEQTRRQRPTEEQWNRQMAEELARRQANGATLPTDPAMLGLLTDALASEYEAIGMYDNIVQKAGLADNPARLVAESILVDEREHAGQLDALLHPHVHSASPAPAECEVAPLTADAPIGGSGDVAEWVSGIGGSPGIVVDADEAQAYPCIRIELRPGHTLVYAKGIIGPLDADQQTLYCREYVERHPTEKQKARMEAMSEAARVCRVESVAPTTEEHLVRYFSCLGRELKAKGVQV